MTTESASILYSLITTALLGSVWLIFGRDIRADALRRELRMLHVDLLKLGSSEPYCLSQPDYTKLNNMIRMMVVNAHRMTATRLLLASLVLQHCGQEKQWDACYMPIRDRLLTAVAIHAIYPLSGFKIATHWLTFESVESALSTIED
jgi:hypothetical protein